MPLKQYSTTISTAATSRTAISSPGSSASCGGSDGTAKQTQKYQSKHREGQSPRYNSIGLVLVILSLGTEILLGISPNVTIIRFGAKFLTRKPKLRNTLQAKTIWKTTQQKTF